jgi:acyl-CoA synthetase (AMP-forming)/AMP-acid ligase II
MSTQRTGPLARDEAIAILKSKGSPYGVTTKSVGGVEFDIFEHAPNDMREWFSFANRHFPEREFLVYDDERLTYGEVHERSVALCKNLTDLGVVPGDRVAIAMRNYPEYSMAIEAILAAGAVAVTLNSWWQEDELEYGVRDSGARFAIVDQERWMRLAPSLAHLDLGVAIARPEGALSEGVLSLADLTKPTPGAEFPSHPIDTDSDALIMYTSGSTAHPKGVVLTHRSIINSILNFSFNTLVGNLIQEDDEGVRNDVFTWAHGGAAAMDDPVASRLPRMCQLVNVPFFHVTALHTMLFQAYRDGRKLILMYKWIPEKALELTEREAITFIGGVPTQIGEILNSPDRPKRDLSSLTVMAGGGSARPPEHVKLLQQYIPHAIPAIGYGMTETNAAGATVNGDDYVARPMSVGPQAPPLITIEIRDEEGRALGPNGEGEICMKSALNMRCYWNKPEATAEALRDGWMYSGDIGHLDEDGFLFITGRAKDIIIRGGENIACGEVENVLYEHPAVNEAAAHGVPDDRFGECVCATVYLKEGTRATEEEIRAHVSGHLAAFKVPSHVLFVEKPLPRVASGKFDKRQLVQCATERLR